VKDFARRRLQQELLRRRQPVDRAEVGRATDPDPALEPGVHGVNVDMMRNRHVVPAESDRPAAEGLRQPTLQSRGDCVDVARLDEQLEPGSPAVVGRAPRVEAEDLGPFTEPCRGVFLALEQGSNDLRVKPSGQFQAGNEVSHPRSASPPG
jgi:hypothetical protein